MRALLLARSDPPLARPNYNASGASAGVTFAGTRGDNVAVGSAFNDTLQGQQGDDTITGGAGDDSIGDGVGIDAVVYAGAAINFTVDTLGADISVRDTSGTEGTDTLMLIVITRNGTNNASIMAELDNIEEIKINAMLPSANNGDGFVNCGTSDGDAIIVVGDFTTTSLDYSTIRVQGSTGNDTIDISGLTSDHRLLFDSNGGTDALIGDTRPQDVMNGITGVTVGTLNADKTVLDDFDLMQFAGGGRPSPDTELRCGRAGLAGNAIHGGNCAGRGAGNAPL